MSQRICGNCLLPHDYEESCYKDSPEALELPFPFIQGQESSASRQVGGDHYRKLGAYQPWEVLKRWLTPEEFRGYMKGSVIAYLARERDKGGDQDIEKAAHTLDALVEDLRKVAA